MPSIWPVWWWIRCNILRWHRPDTGSCIYCGKITDPIAHAQFMATHRHLQRKETSNAV